MDDYRRALRLTRDVLIHAERMDQPLLWALTARMRGEILRVLGRTNEARALLEQFKRRVPMDSPCGRADALDLIGRQSFELRREDHTLVEARTALHEAIALYRNVCPKPRRLAFSLAYLGALELSTGNIRRAAENLAASRAAHARPGVGLLLAQRELAAEIALRRRQFRDAVEAFGHLEASARRLIRPRSQWPGALGRGKALEKLGRYDEALAAYQQAEDLLERHGTMAPFGGGRESFLRTREESAARLINLLLHQGKIREAAAAARRSRRRRRRVLAALHGSARLEAAPEDAREKWYRAASAHRQHRAQRESEALEDWRLSRSKLEQRRAEQVRTEDQAQRMLDEALAALGSSASRPVEPPAVPPGELWVTYHPTPRGWVAFAFARQRISFHSLGKVTVDNRSPADLAGMLLRPLSTELKQAERIRFLPYGSLNAVDFHSLPFEGQPLIASKAVAYSVDVTPAPSVPEPRAHPRALIVDPHDDLSVSLHEANQVQTRLQSEDWQVQRLHGRRASPRVVHDALAGPGVDLLHYAGHARFSGLDGWQSRLGTQSRSLLTVGDILLLPRTPTQVVLNGCETAATSRVRGAAGLGLAQAFIIAGSHWAIAAVRPVRDHHAEALITELYAGATPGRLWDAPELLRRAQLKVRAERPLEDWASFRVLVP